MKVDHGFTITMLKLFGGIDGAVVLPVFVNCAAHPRPSFKRVRQLGEAIGAFAASLPMRTVLIGSGGLSHDPPTPRLNAPNGIVITWKRCCRLFITPEPGSMACWRAGSVI